MKINKYSKEVVEKVVKDFPHFRIGKNLYLVRGYTYEQRKIFSPWILTKTYWQIK